MPYYGWGGLIFQKNGTNSSIPGNWWIEAPMGYAPRAFVGVNSTQKTEAPRLLIVPAETLNRMCPTLQSTLDSMSDLKLRLVLTPT